MLKLNGRFVVTGHEIKTGILLCPTCQEELLGCTCTNCNQSYNICEASYPYKHLTNLDKVKDLIDNLVNNDCDKHAKVLATVVNEYYPSTDIQSNYLEAYALLSDVVKAARTSKNHKVKQLGIRAAAVRYVLAQALINT